MTLAEKIRRISVTAFRNVSRRWLLAAGASLATVASIAAGVWLWSHNANAAAEPTRRIPASAALNSVICSPDGGFLVAGCVTGDVVVCELPSGRTQLLPKLATDPITTLSLSSTSFLIAGTVDREVVGWQLGTGEVENTLSFPEFPAPVAASAVHPNRFDALVGLSDGSIYHFVRDQEPRRLSSRHAGGVKSICYRPDAASFVTGGTDGRLIWRIAETLRIESAVRAHSNEVGGLAFSADGQLLASGDYDGLVIVRDGKTTEEVFRFREPDAVSALAFTEAFLITGSWDGRLSFWSLATQELSREIQTEGPVLGLAVDANSDTLATVHGTDAILLWSIVDE